MLIPAQNWRTQSQVSNLLHSAEARHFALQALAVGPPALMMDIPVKPINSIELSPDGKWMAVGVKGGLQLYPRDGTAPITVTEPYAPNLFIPWSSQFSADGKFLIWTMRQDTRIVKVWSMSEKKIIRVFNLEGNTIVLVRSGVAFFITDATGSHDAPFGWSKMLIRKWRFDQSKPEIVDRFQIPAIWWKSFDIDEHGRWITYTKAGNVYVRPFGVAASEKIFGPHPTNAQYVKFRPNSNEVASSDVYGLIQIWSLDSETKTPIRTMNLNGELGYIWFDPEGRLHLCIPRCTTLSVGFSCTQRCRSSDLSIPRES